MCGVSIHGIRQVGCSSLRGRNTAHTSMQDDHDAQHTVYISPDAMSAGCLLCTSDLKSVEVDRVRVLSIDYRTGPYITAESGRELVSAVAYRWARVRHTKTRILYASGHRCGPGNGRWEIFSAGLMRFQLLCAVVPCSRPHSATSSTPTE